MCSKRRKNHGNGKIHLVLLNVHIDRHTSSHSIYHLPVFYLNLDPAKIPNIAELDEKIRDPDVSATITAAILCLDALYFLHETPPGAYPDLWPRVWKWTDFLETYPYCNRYASSHRAQDISLHFFYYVARLRQNPTTACLIDSTPRVRIFIAKIWGILVETEDYREFEDLCDFIGRDIAVSDAEHFEEFVEGSGGTVADLASLVVEHITWTTSHLTSDVCSKGLFLLDCCIRFLIATNFDTCYAQFNAALVDRGIVKALIGAVLALEEATVEETANVLEDCLVLLEWTMDVSDSRSWVTEALDAGLIRAIISCAVHNCIPTSATLESLHRLLIGVLPESLIYHSILSSIMASFAAAKDLLHLPCFMESEIFEAWQGFKELVKERLQVLIRFDSGEFRTRRACENVQCQRYDWKQGGHRNFCALHRQARSSAGRDLSARDRSFMRAILHHDYTVANEEIFHGQIQFMRADPTAEFYLSFDYSACVPTVEIKDVSDNPGYAKELWDDYFSRARACAGRMELHLIVAGNGRKSWFMMIPMRSDSARIHEEMKRVARSMEIVSDNYRIARLIREREENVVYIH
ncbi:hypothetical protein B0H11DRAFT_1907210 [Mycena galericulata]|nr:hypothetical protein B0H11DRAFT_1907210 [Mycena galericulata]